MSEFFEFPELDASWYPMDEKSKRSNYWKSKIYYPNFGDTQIAENQKYRESWFQCLNSKMESIGGYAEPMGYTIEVYSTSPIFKKMAKRIFQDTWNLFFLCGEGSKILTEKPSTHAYFLMHRVYDTLNPIKKWWARIQQHPILAFISTWVYLASISMPTVFLKHCLEIPK